MRRALNNLPIRLRMLLSVALFIITLGVALVNAYQSIMANAEFAIQEKKGNAYQRPLALILNDSATLRLRLIQQRSGLDKAGEIAALSKSIDAEMSSLQKVHAELGEDLQFTEEGLASRGRSHLKFETVHGKWTALAEALKTDKDGAQIEDLAAFIADIRGMIAHSGDTSNLILDPDLDSYYLMDVTLLAAPQTLDRLSVIAEKIYPLLTKGYRATQDDRILTASTARLLKESDIDRIAADIDTSMKEDKNFQGVSPAFEAKLKPIFDAYIEKNTALFDSLGKDSVDQAEFVRLWLDALGATGTFLNAGYDELDDMLDARIASYQDKANEVIMTSLLGIAISMIFFMVVANSITKPLGSLTGVMSALAKGDLAVSVPFTESRSEIGSMAAAVQVFKENALEAERLRSEQEIQKQRAEEDKRRAMSELAGTFEREVGGVIDSVTGSSTQMETLARTMSSNADQTSQQTTIVAASAEEASANVQAVASAAEELSISIGEISHQVTKSSEIAAEARQRALETSSKVSSLESAVNKIGAVVTLISEIAEQTNLLALNATIEAARAGDAGKGFAVVASEVKNLATQTASATGDITTQINGVQESTLDAARSIRAVSEVIDKMDQISAAVAAAVEEQGAATREIARNVQEASTGTRDVSCTIGKVSLAATETEATAQIVLTSAADMTQQAGRLRKAVNEFLMRVRTG